jgi:23S rRNA (uracil1939-C5)-methyltransferase
MEEIEINISPEEEKGVLILPFHSFHQGLEKFLDEFLQLHLVLKGVAIVKKGGWVFLGNSHLNFTIPLSRYGEKRHLRLRTSPESFFQVNLKQNQTLIQTVLNLAELKGDERVLDLYAGVGNLTLPLAIGAKEVLGIEENKMAVEDGRFNTERNRIKNCTFISERVEDILGHWKRGNPDLVVLDPPRMGCKGILNPLVRLRPKKIVYVSCEPTTFSRDLRLFSDNGYYLQRLMLIDMFPQTYHMEVVGLLTPL